MLSRTASDAGDARIQLRLERSSHLDPCFNRSNLVGSVSNLMLKTSTPATVRSYLSSSAPQLTSPSLTGNSLSTSAIHRRLTRDTVITRRHSNRNRRTVTQPLTSSPGVPPRCRSPMMEASWNSSTGAGGGPIRQLFSNVANSKNMLLRAPRATPSENRRWSFASLPSSGCITTPGSSAFSSQYSSSEQLDEHGVMFGSNDSYPSLDATCTQIGELALRPRSRSLNSSPVSSHSDVEAGMRINLYKERFSKAKLEMESRLAKFLELEELEPSLHLVTDGAANFVRHQILELTSDCLTKSQQDQVTATYFCEITDKLEELLFQASEKCCSGLEELQVMVRKLLIIIAKPARLLECLEFNPDQFYALLEEVEGVAREAASEPIPQYIIKKLGLTSVSPELPSDVATEVLGSGSGAESTDSGAVVFRHRSSKINSSHSFGSMDASGPSKIRMPKEDDFESIKLVSNGAYGAVHLVRHRETRQRFAMKKLSKTNLVLRNQIDQVFAERDILTFTDNPFVVSFYGSFETKKYLCLVLEYVEGGDCATLLKQISVFPVDMARMYIAETVLAVEYLHSYGIVHRDLKPDNLLITSMGHIKLTDFGLSRIGLMNRTLLCEDWEEVRQFKDNQVIGTPSYIAPEVILRQGYGKPVDWWSLGIILYEFLVGCTPFFGDTPEELFAHVISGEIEWPEEPYTPPFEAQALILALLQQNALNRVGSRSGAVEVKAHPFFSGINWENLLRQKAEFIPCLADEEDTSYFDDRGDRYQHDDDTNDEVESGSTSSSIFSSFTSSSPRFSFLAEMASLGRSDSESSSQSSPGLIPAKPGSGISAGSAGSSGGRIVRSIPKGGGAPSQLAIDHSLVSTSKPAVPPDKPKVPLHQHHHHHFHHKHQKSTIAKISSEEEKTLQQMGESVQIRRRRTATVPLPRFSISCDPGQLIPGQHLYNASFQHQQDGTSDSAIYSSGTPSSSQIDHQDLADPDSLSVPSHSSHSASSSRKNSNDSTMIMPGDETQNKALKSRSISAQGLHLVIPPPEALSVAGQIMKSPGGSSTSSRDTSPTGFRPFPSFLKPPIIIRRGPSGFGFTLRAIRVYIGESDYYTLQHIVTDLEETGPAYEAGLRKNDLITHVNSEPVSNQLHTTVVQMLLSGKNVLNLRVTPLDQTSIKTGPARRAVGYRARRKGPRRKIRGTRRSSRSLFRRLSGKRAAADFKTLSRSVSTSEGLLAIAPGADLPAGLSNSVTGGNLQSTPVGNPLQSRPSSLYGLGHKLAMALKSPRLRKQSNTMPLSPLARAEQRSPARSPSPVPTGYNPGGKKTFTKPRKSDAGCEPTDGFRYPPQRKESSASSKPSD